MRAIAIAAMLLLVGCKGGDLAERCNERGGVFAQIQWSDRRMASRSMFSDAVFACFRPDTIPLAVLKP